MPHFNPGEGLFRLSLLTVIRRLITKIILASMIAVGCQGCIVFTRVPPTPGIPRSAAPATRSNRISREDAIADLEALMRTLENVHPAPYFLRSREDVFAQRQQLVSSLPDSMSRAEWWTRLAPFVASLGDGHTLLSNPFEEESAELDGVSVFPADVKLDENRHFIIAAVHGNQTSIERGDRILSVNGRDADSLLSEWTRERSGDSLAGRMTDVADRFKTFLLIHAMLPPYMVTLASADGIEKTVTLQGLPAMPEADTLFAYRKLGPDIGYMNFLSMSGDFGRFKRDLAAMFRQVRNDSVQTFLIDLRHNGGGDDALGDELLRYISQKPYRGWSGGEVKRSAELRSYDKAYYRIPFRWLPLYLFFSQERMIHFGEKGSFAAWPEQPVTQKKKAEPFFAGPVCVLTGPYTFSAAVIFADAIKTYHLATLIGEETGGHPNFFSEAYDFRLPRSGLLASVSTTRWVRANGDTKDANGVIPDIVVKTTTDDIRAARDPVLERALSCPKID